MKNALRLFVMAALTAAFALTAFAQAPAPAASPAATGPCTEADAQAALYQKFLKEYKGTPEQQKLAYESGKEYLTKYGNCPEDSVKQVAAFVQKWVSKYEAATVEFNCTKAANESPAQAFEACKAWIAANPDNLRPHLALVAAGIKAYANKDNSLNARAEAEARTALQLIESGKTTDVWAPFASQADAPAGLRYYIAAWTFETNPDEAANQLRTVAQSNSAFAKEPATYQLLGAAYYNGEYKKLAAEYKEKYEGKEETPESAALFNRINAVLARIVDAYARAVALSAGKPQQAQLRNTLATFYKQRNDGKEDGLNELVANVLSKPLMLPGQEPAPPAPAPPSTTGTNGTATPATTPAGTTTTPASTTPKPAPTPQKPPRN